MTDLQAAEALLAEKWEETVSGRSTDVPEPEIVLSQGVSQSDLKTQDYARIVDGGGRSYTPRGFGWTHESVQADVVIELRSSDRRVNGTKINGRERMFGVRDGLDKPDRHGGLRGETRRILQDVRKGFAEFDRVLASDVTDESDAEGKNVYRCDVAVTFVQDAKQVDPSV